MENPHTTAIVGRFFESLDRLKSSRAIRSKKAFTDRYGINRRNLDTCKKRPDSGMFQIGWLFVLVRDFGISPTWLLTGEGDFLLDGDRAGRPAGGADSCKKVG